MTDYLAPFLDWDNPKTLDVFDEAPLWSAMFGQMLLDAVPMQHGMHYLDLACGAGFPLVDLAQRLGPTCKAYGVDGWFNALDRAQIKKAMLQVKHLALLGGDGEALPFADQSLDLITINLGVNNFANTDAVLSECARTLKDGGTLALTTNVRGHMQAFYDVFSQTLLALDEDALLMPLAEHINHRHGAPEIEIDLNHNGIEVTHIIEHTFTMRFLDGTAFLTHAFIRMAFMEAWVEFIPAEKRAPIFTQLEANLNTYAANHDGLTMTIPAICMLATVDR